MALSDQLAEGVRNYPIDDHGKFRTQYFRFENTTGGTLDAGTEIELFDLPPGRVRILLNLSRWRATAMSIDRVLDVGHRAYHPRGADDPSITPEAEDPDAFVDAVSVASAVNNQAWGAAATAIKFDLFSRSGVRVFATVSGGTIPNGAVVEGYCVYVYE